MLSFLFGLVLVAALAALGFAAWRLFRTPTHEIPDQAGLTEQEALSAIEGFNWDVATDVTRDDTYDTPGDVVRTSPVAGRDLAEGSPLVLYVSEGPEYRVLPNLAGLTVDDATAELTELRRVVGTTTEQYDEVVAAGIVISNSVDGATVGENVLPGTPVSLIVSQGPEPRTVPDLRGKSEDQAARLLEQFGLQLAMVEPVHDDEVADGLIATQTPAAASELERGGTVSAALSLGPDLVAMPDLAGLTLPEIREALAAAGLEVGGLLGSTQGTFYAASVDGRQVQPNDPVRRGSSVDLIVL
ncbi:MAG: PASTA domain-containing protein [Acidimicrobiia bacterium]|nr:PASTA domain-containing protein [Acidimicrobiia bacterium]